MDSYNVTAEVQIAPTPARINATIDRLESYHPAVSRNDFGHMEIVISVPAESLQQATTTAAALVGAGIIRLEVMTSALFDQRVGVEPIPDLIGATEAADLLGVSRQRVAQMVQEGKLPGRMVGKSLAIPRAAIKV